MSQPLAVTTPYLDLLGANATGWARGATVARKASVHQAIYADQDVVRRAPGVADYTLSVAADAETSTAEASAAIWANVGTAGALELRGDTAAVAAANPKYTSPGDATGGVFCSSFEVAFVADNPATVAMEWAVDGTITRATA